MMVAVQSRYQSSRLSLLILFSQLWEEYLERCCSSEKHWQGEKENGKEQTEKFFCQLRRILQLCKAINEPDKGLLLSKFTAESPLLCSI